LDQPPYERNNGSSRFSLATNPLTGLPGETQYMGVNFNRVFATNHNDWAPRVAFAYNLFGNEKTVLRGGYSMFYAYSFGEYTASYGDINGFGSTNTSYTSSVSVFPAFQFSGGLPHPPTPPQGSQLGPNLAFSSNDFKVYENYSPTPRSQQWDFGVQQQIGKNAVFSATYTGNRGTHLIASGYNLNQLNPSYYSLGNQLLAQVPNPYAGKVPGPYGAATETLMQTLLPYPWLGAVTVANPHLGKSIYHALLLSAQKRYSQGLVLLTSFTFGKLISEGVENTVVTSSYSLPQYIGLGYQNGLYDRAAERGVDPNSVPWRWVTSASYALPFGKGKGRLMYALIGGWQFNNIFTLSAGLPISVRGANNNVADRPLVVGNPALPSGYKDPNSNLGVPWINPAAFANPPIWQFGNVPLTLAGFYAPGLFNIDSSLFKDFRLTEKVRLQFRAEAYNVLNHVNLGAPNATFSANLNQTANTNALFGRITTSGFTSGQFAGSTYARQIQLALKLMF
jgi:hypothetical protein